MTETGLVHIIELQVVALVTTGKMNKQMAGELALSEITVKSIVVR